MLLRQAAALVGMSRIPERDIRPLGFSDSLM